MKHKVLTHHLHALFALGFTKAEGPGLAGDLPQAEDADVGCYHAAYEPFAEEEAAIRYGAADAEDAALRLVGESMWFGREPQE